MNLRFERHPGGGGLRIDDPIEGTGFDLYTPGPVSPVETATDGFYFPVDAAARVRASAVEVPKLTDVFVRTADGDLVADSRNGEPVSVPAGRYGVEIGGAPMKLYLSVESPVRVDPGEDAVTVRFDGETTVVVGARSLHERPAGTVTVTGSVHDAMAAVSLLGSALKTLSPERSFPTLRGHPPLIELGDELSVPPGIRPPGTGVRIEVPPTYDHLFPVAPLSYYLGAEVVPGESPRLVAGGFEHPLSGPAGFEREVGRVLRQAFFLDCLVRTEGYYPVDLHERSALEGRLALDFADLYDRSLAEQIAAYLSVPFGVVADHLPTWRLTTDVAPTASNLDVLPFAADDLAIVRCPPEPATVSPRPQPNELAAFYRGDGDGDDVRSVTGGSTAGRPRRQVVQPDGVDTVEHAWVGDGVPMGASKATADAYRRRVEHTAEDVDIAVDVVCNDERMDEEGVVEELYGDRDRVGFDVSMHRNLSTGELRELLASSADFLHYVGHVDDGGIACPDGYLDVRTLETVGVDAFLLNACRSYDQGEALVERGAIAGVVTLRPVGNHGATSVGRALARLLNCGFPLRAALTVAREESFQGSDYIVVGDGNLSLVQPQSLYPVLAVVEADGGSYSVTLEAYPTAIGGLFTPNVGDDPERYVAGGEIDTFSMSADELRTFVDGETFPLLVEDELRWSDELDSGELTADVA